MIKSRKKWIPIKEKKSTKAYDRLARQLAPILKRMLNNPKLTFIRALLLRAQRQNDTPSQQ